MAKKIKAQCYMCDFVGYIPEDYTGKIKCTDCGAVFKRTGIPLSEIRKQLLERLDNYQQTGIKQVRLVTARDDHVCEECKNKEGKVYTIDEMRSVLLSNFCISNHFEQNCRCLLVAHRD